MRACVGAEPRERRGWGGAACEVYGALVERLTAKALRQMQHWTDLSIGTGWRLPKCTVDEPRADAEKAWQSPRSARSANAALPMLHGRIRFRLTERRQRAARPIGPLSRGSAVQAAGRKFLDLKSSSL